MPSSKQTKFIQGLLGKAGYHSEDWRWLSCYGVKEAGKLIDKLLHESKEWKAEFIAKLPEPVHKNWQAELSLPPPKPLAPDDPVIPPEVAEFKHWAREVFQRGEQTFAQLCALYDARFGNPFAGDR